MSQLSRIPAHPARLFAHIVLACLLAPTAVALSQQSDLEKAAALLQSGDMEGARQAYQSILAADSANPAAQAAEVAVSERLALKARAGGDLDGALRILLQARDLVPRNARLLYDLGILEDQMQLYKDADLSLDAAAQLNPQDSRILYAAGRVKMDLGQLDVAEEKMAAYLSLHPEDATALYGLGRVFQLGMQFDKARTAFQKSIDLQPSQTEAYYQLGDIAMHESNFDQAIANFNTTLLRNPRHGGALAGLGESYFLQKKYDQAIPYLRQAIAAAPDYQPGHYYLGLSLARIGKSEESQRELQIAEQLADAQNRKASRRLQLNLPASAPHP